jgi:hypothetical protein
MFHLITICGLALPFVTAANAQEIDWKKVDDAIGRGAAVAAMFIATTFRGPIST